MYTSLKHIKDSLESSTIILPGHNYSVQKTSTLKEEMNGNPFFHFNDLENLLSIG